MTDPVRRDLLRGSAALAASCTAARLLPPALASADGGPTLLGQPVGLQLYSLRHRFPKDVPGTLAKVYALGFREVEGGADYGLGIAGFMGAGLTLTSALFGYEDWSKDTAAAVRRATELGARYSGCASIPHKDRFTREDCLRAAADFNQKAPDERASPWGRG